MTKRQDRDAIYVKRQQAVLAICLDLSDSSMSMLRPFFCSTAARVRIKSPSLFVLYFID